MVCSSKHDEKYLVLLDNILTKVINTHLPLDYKSHCLSHSIKIFKYFMTSNERVVIMTQKPDTGAIVDLLDAQTLLSFCFSFESNLI